MAEWELFYQRGGYVVNVKTTSRDRDGLQDNPLKDPESVL